MAAADFDWLELNPFLLKSLFPSLFSPFLPFASPRSLGESKNAFMFLFSPSGGNSILQNMPLLPFFSAKKE